MTRKVLLAGASILAFSFAAPADSQQAVLCVNCATFATQVSQFARQLLQLEQEITTAENEAINTFALPASLFTDLTCRIQQLQNIVNAAQMLAGNTQGMLMNLSATGGYPIATVQQFNQLLINDQNAVARALTAAGSAIAGLAPAADSQNFLNLANQASGVVGRLQAQQSIAGTNNSLGQQIAQGQATRAAVDNALLTVQAARVDRDAAEWQLSMNNRAAAAASACAAGAAAGVPGMSASWCNAGTFPAQTTAGTGQFTNMTSGYAPIPVAACGGLPAASVTTTTYLPSSTIPPPATNADGSSDFSG